LKNPPDKAQLEEKILGSDLIYVGGGNTLKMMKVWRRLGVDQMLLEAAHRGIVLSGLSAGAICWFRYGHSDSPSFTASGEWNYMRVRGLSLIDTMYCPHYHAEKREQPLENMILKRGGHAIACDNNTAIEILDGHYRILGSQGAPKAYKIFKRQGKVIIEKIVASEQLQPIEELF
jgi:dipeptidase E